jgi:hypothetical protein
MEGVGQTKLKYAYSRDTLETPLDINLNINNEKQD